MFIFSKWKHKICLQITRLSEVQMEIVRLIGINESAISKLHCGIISKV